MSQELQSAPVNYLTPEDPVSSAETVHERVRPLVNFLLDRFTLYATLYQAQFILNIKCAEDELVWYTILLNDVQVLQERFNQPLPQSIAHKLGTLELLHDMVQWKLVVARNQRRNLDRAGRVIGGAAVAGVAASAALALVPVGLGIAGFTSTGVVGGSWAASVQTAITVKGSWFAVAQSVGAAGLSGSTVTGVTTAGVVTGGAVGGVCAKAETVDDDEMVMILVPDNLEFDEDKKKGTTIPLDVAEIVADPSFAVETALIDHTYERIFSWEHQECFQKLRMILKPAELLR